MVVAVPLWIDRIRSVASLSFACLVSPTSFRNLNLAVGFVSLLNDLSSEESPKGSLTPDHCR